MGVPLLFNFRSSALPPQFCPPFLQFLLLVRKKFFIFCSNNRKRKYLLNYLFDLMENKCFLHFRVYILSLVVILLSSRSLHSFLIYFYFFRIYLGNSSTISPGFSPGKTNANMNAVTLRSQVKWENLKALLEGKVCSSFSFVLNMCNFLFVPQRTGGKPTGGITRSQKPGNLLLSIFFVLCLLPVNCLLKIHRSLFINLQLCFFTSRVWLIELRHWLHFNIFLPPRVIY